MARKLIPVGSRRSEISQTIWAKLHSVVENSENCLMSRAIQTKWIRFNGNVFVVFLEKTSSLFSERCLGTFSHGVVENGYEWRDADSGAYQHHALLAENRFHGTRKGTVEHKDQLSRCWALAVSTPRPSPLIFPVQLQLENLFVELASPVAAYQNHQTERRALIFQCTAGNCERMPFECGDVFALQQNKLSRLDGEAFINFEREENCILRRQLHRDGLDAGEETLEVANDEI